MKAPAGNIEPGYVLANRFAVERLLGEGAVGAVWLTRDRELDDEPVAIKVLHPGALRDRSAIADLKREVLIARRLRHPNILAIYTFWQDAAAHFITMEHVDGASLATLIADRGQAMTVGESLPIIGQLCAALDFAHAAGVLHRDIKPANVILDRDGHVRLVDFGIARALLDGIHPVNDSDRSGTIQFMSPEQLRGLPADHRSDQYSLASTVYEMLAGHPPFRGSEVIVQVQLKPVTAIDALPDEVNAILIRGLEKNPERRFASCTDLYHHLHQAAEKAGILDALLPSHIPQTEADTVKLDPPHPQGLHKRLGAILVAAGAITSDQLDAALKKQSPDSSPLGEILLEMGALTEEAMADALDKQLGLGRAYPTRKHAKSKWVKKLPKGFAADHRCIPMEKNSGHIRVAMADPLDLETIDALERHLNASVEPRVATPSAISAAFSGK